MPAQLRVEVDGPDVDLVSGLLWELGTTGIEERAAGRSVLLLAAFDDNAAATAARDALGRPAEMVEVAADAGLDAWREHARTERGGPFVVVPAWLDAPPLGPGERVVTIDPGRAFGSGSHPTTRLVLAEVGRLVAPGRSVLDVGCGSGVLAVAAALGGADPVVAVDVDPEARSAARANAAANGVGGQVHVRDDAVGAVAGPFDLVLANLLAPVIVELAADLRRLVAPGGALVLSGLLADRWPAALGAFAGWATEAVPEDDGWVAVTLRSPATGAAPP